MIKDPTRPTQRELDQILKQHRLWLDDAGGTQANLTGRNLRRRDLSNTNLSRAVLTGADLTEATGPGHMT